MLSEITDLIFIGDSADVQYEKELMDRDVSAVFNVASEVHGQYKKLRYYKYPFTECLTNKKKLKELMKKIRYQLKRKNKIVVHCYAGIDRAPTIVTCYLIKNGMNKTDAWRLVKKKRPMACYHGSWIDKLINEIETR
jgi:protein-tyrosine phosphatase